MRETDREKIKVTCVECGLERHIIHRSTNAMPSRCRPCNMRHLDGSKGRQNPHWRGGRTKMGKYIRITVTPDDFFYPMATCSNTILEHRLVMAKHLGRNLHCWEIVHHKNGVRDDNRIGNLQLVTEGQHNQVTIMQRRITKLEEKLASQVNSIRLLQWQIKELNKVLLQK